MRKWLLLLTILLFALPVFAAGGSKTVDFDAESYAYQIKNGTLGTGQTGNGVDRVVTWSSSSHRSTATIQVLIPVNCHVSSATFYIRHAYSNTTFSVQARFYDSSLNNFSSSGGNQTIPANTWSQRTVTPSSPVNTAYVGVYVAQTSGLNVQPSSYSFTLKMDDIVVTCSDDTPHVGNLAPEGGGTWSGNTGQGGGGGFSMRPLAAADQDTTFPLQDKPDSISSLFDTAYIVTQWGGPEVLQAVSNAPGAYVHAIAPGVVTQINLIKPSTDCGLWDSGDAHQIDGNSSTAQCWVMLTSGDKMLLQTFSGGFVVRVEYNDDIGNKWFFDYIVDTPGQYVSIGDEVTPGCVLGLTLALGVPSVVNVANLSGYAALDNSPPLAPSGFDMGDILHQLVTPSNKGFAAVYAFNWTMSEAQRLAPFEYPSNSTPCKNHDERYADCLLSNPTFSNFGEGWEGNSETLFGEGGVPALLKRGGTIWRSFLLNNSKEYTLTVSFLTETVEPLQLFIELGTERHQETIPIGVTDAQLALGPSELQETQAYNIGIRYSGPYTNPLGVNGIQVRYLCLTEGAPDTSPGSCYFNNPYFDYGFSGWTSYRPVISAGAVTEGTVYISAGGHLAQNVHLFPNGEVPQEYRLNVSIVGFNAQGYSGADPDYITLNYLWPSTPVKIADISIADFQLVDIVTVDKIITVSTETNATFAIQAKVYDAEDNELTDTALKVRFTSACISGNFPGQTGIDKPPFIEACAAVDRPVAGDESISSWTLFHWNNLKRFFQCDLMRLLNQMFQTIQNFFRTVGYLGRYGISSYKSGIAWLKSDLFPWAEGYLRNLTFDPIVTGPIFPPEQEGCHDIFCALVAIFDNIAGVFRELIAFFQRIVDWVGQLLGLIVNGIIGLIVTVIAQLFSLLSFAEDVLLRIIDAAMTTQPQAIPGLPDCTLIDPRTHWLCTAVWVLDNTIFTPGTPGPLLIWLIIAIGSITLTIWVFREFKKTITEVGQLA